MKEQEVRMWEQGDRFRRLNPNHPSSKHLEDTTPYPIYSIIQNQILQENKHNNANKGSNKVSSAVYDISVTTSKSSFLPCV